MTERKTAQRTIAIGALLMVIGLVVLLLGWLYKDFLPAAGSTLLGFMVGMFVGFFAQETKEWSRSAMTASVAVLTGAGVLALLRFSAPDPQAIWFYPAGLIIGFGFGTIWEEIDPA